jgi:hypothetical protein
VSQDAHLGYPPHIEKGDPFHYEEKIMTTTTTTILSACTSAFNATVEFCTPLASVLGQTVVETGKFSVYTVEATAGSALQVAVAARMGMQVVKSVAPSNVAEAELNMLSALAMLNTNNSDTEEK